jgi:hypothetical protein
MDFGSFLLILGLLILVGLYISKPLLERTATVVSAEEQKFSTLQAERDRILTALQELDFDHTLGKIPDESYPVQRTMLLQKGAAVLRQIDEFHGDSEVDVDGRLETAIADRRGAADGALVDDDLEALIANRRRARAEKSGGFCPQCGNPVQQSDQFCPKCGATLAVRG